MERLHRGCVPQWSVFREGASFISNYYKGTVFYPHLEWLDVEAQRWVSMLNAPPCLAPQCPKFDPVEDLAPQWMTIVPERWNCVLRDFRICYSYLILLVSQEDPRCVLAAYNVRAACLGLHIIMSDFLTQSSDCYHDWIDRHRVVALDESVPMISFPAVSYLPHYPVPQPSERFLKLVGEMDLALVVWKKNISDPAIWRKRPDGSSLALDLIYRSGGAARLVASLTNSYRNLMYHIQMVYDAERSRRDWCPLRVNKSLQDVTTLSYYFTDFLADGRTRNDVLKRSVEKV